MTDKDKSASSDSEFDCNICFDQAKEPVVTRCGHLFCWKCIDEWLSRGQTECPLCKAGVTKDNVIPLYGRGGEAKDPRDKPRSERPKAERPVPEPRRRQGFFESFGGMSDGGFSVGLFPFGLIGSWNFNTDGAHGAHHANAHAGEAGSAAAAAAGAANTGAAGGAVSPDEQRRELISQLLVLFGAIFFVWLVNVECWWW